MSPTIRDEPIEMPFGGVDSRGSLIFYYMGVEAFLGGGVIFGHAKTCPCLIFSTLFLSSNAVSGYQYSSNLFAFVLTLNS